MSNVSNFHSITSYSGSEKPLSGQRLVPVTFKTDKVTGIKPESKCVSIPFAYDSFGSQLLDNWKRIEKHVLSLFEETQNKIIREAVTENKTQIHSEEIGFFACLDLLEQENSGGRLSKELLSTWFSDEVEPVLATVLCEKLGVVNDSPNREQEKKLEVTLNLFKERILSLAGTKTLFGDDIIAQLKKCFSLVSSSPLKEKLEGKLEEMKRQNSLMNDGLIL